jgi:hypothetical protein
VRPRTRSTSRHDFAGEQQEPHLAPRRLPVGGRYVAETYAERLPKASTGKSRVRFKRLSDVDTAALAELLRTAAEHPPGGTG